MYEAETGRIKTNRQKKIFITILGDFNTSLSTIYLKRNWWVWLSGFSAGL